MRQVVTRVPPVTAVVPAVRARTVEVLTAWNVNPTAIDAARLIVSELVGNAVRVSRPDDEFIAVRVSYPTGRVLVEVWSAPDATEVRALEPDLDSEAGRGLFLVEAFAERWDAYRADSGGVVVWARIAAPELPARRDPTRPPLARRTPGGGLYPDPEPVHAPPSGEGSPAIEWSTDPAVLARVVDRLRAKFPWHARPTDDHALTLAGRSSQFMPPV